MRIKCEMCDGAGKLGWDTLKACGWCQGVGDRLPSSEAVHHWFGLSYASYLVLTRAMMQKMPAEWQEKLVALLNEYNETFDHSADYAVQIRDGKTGKFIKDPLCNYRHPPTLPWKKPDPKAEPLAETTAPEK